MGQKKKKRKKKNVSEVDTKTVSAEKESPSTNSKGWVLPFLYVVFGILFCFYMWSAYSAVTKGTFSIIFMLTLATGGFLISVLARKLEGSGYFQFYRVLAILFFLLVAFMYFFMASIDSFTFALLGVFSATLILSSFIPFLFKEIGVEKLIQLSLTVFVVLAISLLMFCTKVFTPSQKTVYFEKLYPFSAIFHKQGKYVQIVGDTRFFNTNKDESISFEVLTLDHPDVALEKMALDDWHKLQNLTRKKKKKNEEKKEEENLPSFKCEGKEFWWSISRDGEFVAVSQREDNQGKNQLFVLNVNNMEKREIYKGKDECFVFPWKCRAFSGYSLWSFDNSKFITFSKNKGGTLDAYVGEVDGSFYPLPMRDVLSGLWSSTGDVILLKGEKVKVDLGKGYVFPEGAPFDTFDFKAKNVHIYCCSKENYQEVYSIMGEAYFMVHPHSGRVFVFKEGKLMVLEDGKLKFEKNFPYKPLKDASGLSYDGKKILIHKPTGEIVIVNIDTSEEILVEKRREFVKDATFSKDGKYLLYFLSSKYSPLMFHSFIRVYDMQTGKKYKVFPNVVTSSVRAASIYPYGFFSDPYRGEIFYDQILYSRRFRSSKNGVSLWQIFPKNVYVTPQGTLKKGE